MKALMMNFKVIRNKKPKFVCACVCVCVPFFMGHDYLYIYIYIYIYKDSMN